MGSTLPGRPRSSPTGQSGGCPVKRRSHQTLDGSSSPDVCWRRPSPSPGGSLRTRVLPAPVQDAIANVAASRAAFASGRPSRARRTASCARTQALAWQGRVPCGALEGDEDPRELDCSDRVRSEDGGDQSPPLNAPGVDSCAHVLARWTALAVALSRGQFPALGSHP